MKFSVYPPLWIAIVAAYWGFNALLPAAPSFTESENIGGSSELNKSPLIKDSQLIRICEGRFMQTETGNEPTSSLSPRTPDEVVFSFAVATEAKKGEAPIVELICKKGLWRLPSGLPLAVTQQSGPAVSLVTGADNSIFPNFIKQGRSFNNQRALFISGFSGNNIAGLIDAQKGPVALQASAEGLTFRLKELGEGLLPLVGDSGNGYFLIDRPLTGYWIAIDGYAVGAPSACRCDLESARCTTADGHEVLALESQFIISLLCRLWAYFSNIFTLSAYLSLPDYSCAAGEISDKFRAYLTAAVIQQAAANPAILDELASAVASHPSPNVIHNTVATTLETISQMQRDGEDPLSLAADLRALVSVWFCPASSSASSPSSASSLSSSNSSSSSSSSNSSSSSQSSSSSESSSSDSSSCSSSSSDSSSSSSSQESSESSSASESSSQESSSEESSSEVSSNSSTSSGSSDSNSSESSQDSSASSQESSTESSASSASSDSSDSNSSGSSQDSSGSSEASSAESSQSSGGSSESSASTESSAGSQSGGSSASTESSASSNPASASSSTSSEHSSNGSGQSGSSQASQSSGASNSYASSAPSSQPPSSASSTSQGSSSSLPPPSGHVEIERIGCPCEEGGIVPYRSPPTAINGKAVFREHSGPVPPECEVSIAIFPPWGIQEPNPVKTCSGSSAGSCSFSFTPVTGAPPQSWYVAAAIATGCNLENGLHNRSVYFGATVSVPMAAQIDERTQLNITGNLSLPCLASLNPQAQRPTWTVPTPPPAPINCAGHQRMDIQVDGGAPGPAWRLDPFERHWYGRVVTPPTDFYCYDHTGGQYEITFPVHFGSCPGLVAEARVQTAVNLNHDECASSYDSDARIKMATDYFRKVVDLPSWCCYQIQQGANPLVDVSRGQVQMPAPCSTDFQCYTQTLAEEQEHERQFEQYTNWTQGGIFHCVGWNRIVAYLGGLGHVYCAPLCEAAIAQAQTALTSAANRAIQDWEQAAMGYDPPSCWMEHTAKTVAGWNCAWSYSCTYARGPGGCPDPISQPPDPCPMPSSSSSSSSTSSSSASSP